MKLMHLGDLHIGKRVNEFSMILDQEYILNEILKIAKEKEVDGVLIAGDIYDKSLPGTDGVNLFDDFLCKLNQASLPVYMISGNHDSPERLNFGSRIFKKNQVFVCGTYQGKPMEVVAEDEYGPLHIYLLPFMKPAMARVFHENVETCEDAVREAIEASQVRKENRNILVCHQFITAGTVKPECCESEISPVGGLDNVDYSLFDAFDYVALGHLHGPQRMGRDTVRYCGSPLKYSFSETNQKKGVTIVTIKEKGNVSYEIVPLVPLHDMRVLKGPIAKLLSPENYTQGDVNDYIKAVLTDENELYDAIGQIRSIYKNVMQLEFDNRRTRENQAVTATKEMIKKTPLELFSDFFMLQNNKEMTEEQVEYLSKMLAKEDEK